MIARHSLTALTLVAVLSFQSVGADDSVPSGVPTTRSLQGTTTWEALNKTVGFDARATPLTDVIGDIAKQAGVDIVVHPQAYASVAVEESEPIDMSLHGICAHSALKMLLQPHNLQFSVLADGRVIIDSDRHGTR